MKQVYKKVYTGIHPTTGEREYAEYAVSGAHPEPVAEGYMVFLASLDTDNEYYVGEFVPRLPWEKENES